MRSARYFWMGLLLLACAGCENNSWLSGYKISIQQGNVWTNRDLKELHLGMSMQEVLDIMGTPILRTLVEPNEWEYVYTFQKLHKERKFKQLILRFKDERLVDIVRCS